MTGYVLGLAFVALGTVPTAGALRARAPSGARHDAVVAGVEVSGGRDAALPARVFEAVTSGLAATGLSIAAVEDAEHDCFDRECGRELAQRTSARTLVRVKVAVTGRDFQMSVEAVDPSTAVAVASVVEVCEVCGVDEAIEALESCVGRVASTLAADVPGVLQITSRPTGARVTIDDRAVGVTPYRAELNAGAHVVVLHKPGRTPSRRRVELAAGVESRLELTLLPSAERAPPRWEFGVGWAAFATGLATLGGGAALLAVHGRPYRGQCSGADVDNDGDCRFALRTRGAGIALLVTAGVLEAVAIGLLVHGRRKHGRRRDRRASRHHSVAVR